MSDWGSDGCSSDLRALYKADVCYHRLICALTVGLGIEIAIAHRPILDDSGDFRLSAGHCYDAAIDVPTRHNAGYQIALMLRLAGRPAIGIKPVAPDILAINISDRDLVAREHGNKARK